MTGRGPNPHDPTAARAVDQSTQSAGGLTAGREGPGVLRNTDEAEELVDRSKGDTTPRRYDQPVEEDERK